MRIHASALKHDIAEVDIEHAWATQSPSLTSILITIHRKSLAIGPDRAGNLLELLYLQLEDDDLIIHAMVLREVFARFLIGDDQ